MYYCKPYTWQIASGSHHFHYTVPPFLYIHYLAGVTHLHMCKICEISKHTHVTIQRWRLLTASVETAHPMLPDCLHCNRRIKKPCHYNSFSLPMPSLCFLGQCPIIPRLVQGFWLAILYNMVREACVCIERIKRNNVILESSIGTWHVFTPCCQRWTTSSSTRWKDIALWQKESGIIYY